ncbi:hypothetical protein ACFVHB_34855 [Kitasatospora sp. NPDC127111]|uniref:hypothetical protein n=1 Tax=Kitasatospora sp. NPDC127111 TaxID=3345363 RepID=UPI00363E001F
MKFTIDTEADAYERACEVVNAAYGRPARPHLAAPLPLARGEVWRDQERPGAEPWSEDLLRAWVRALWGLSDPALAVYWLCGRPGVAVRSYALIPVLAPGAGRGADCVKRHRTCINQALRAARSVGRNRMPFARNEGRRTYTAAPQVARIVLDELSKGPLHAEILERAALAESLAEDGRTA